MKLVAMRPLLRGESLALIVSLWFTLACNPLFWRTLHDTRAATHSDSWSFTFAVAVLITSIHFILLALLLNRWSAKPLLFLLLPLTALAAYDMQRYNVYLDPAMLRNVLHTHAAEAGELFSWQMLPVLMAYVVPPLWLIWRTTIRRPPLLQAAAFRLASVLLALAIGGLSLFAVSQEFSSLMREHKELRYLVTPSNFLYSLARALGNDSRVVSNIRSPIGSDAVLASAWGMHKKPVMLILVIGETARAANWQLSGYERETTPELARQAVINFPHVTACGTHTEVSLPCMFSPFGRHAYDEARIRSSESLLHVLRRAGFRVVWLDNQSGCKGVCGDMETWRPNAVDTPADCQGNDCYDQALLTGLKKYADSAAENTVFVLHPLGNHGPAYYRRYPPAFRHFQPACESPDLGQCSREEIRNAYDNALRYTDHWLASTIDFLKQRQGSYDTAMLYVSDHGESLGENGLFLHGAPYAIAPDVQKQVPMLLWLSDTFARSFNVDARCLQSRANQAQTHDHIFHTVLGLLDVRTTTYDPAYDFTRACRPATDFASSTGLPGHPAIEKRPA
ncbi:MAG TPA: phosphoethanolamine--lipid A transferase [Rhodocyclaceae bacterium]|nr:phosphoethanolamine--lipid A transferase [Rhodocyclaceae bacterium]